MISSNNNLQRVHSVKLLGVWLTDSLDWELNTKEICKKAYMKNEDTNPLEAKVRWHEDRGPTHHVQNLY